MAADTGNKTVKQIPASTLPQVELLDRLSKDFPEITTEGKIDIEKLKAVLGEEVDLGEKYSLGWKGKSSVFKTIQTPTIKALKPKPEESINFDTTNNIFIEGDNLEVLKTLQQAYYGKIKMIYIDPPYNTGNDFVYNDSFSQNRTDYEMEAGIRDEEGYITETSALRKNTRDSGHFHSNWLNMMYPRLYLARNLLRQDGVIFVSIDDNEVQNLRLIMNEIFGEENFVGQISAQLNPRGRNLDEYIAKTHEYLVIYSKNVSLKSTFNKLAKPEDMLAEYNLVDEENKKYRLIELRNRNPAFNQTTRPNLYYPIYINPLNNSVSLEENSEYSVETFPTATNDLSTCWTWNKKKFIENTHLLTAKQTKDGIWRVYRKDYLIDIHGNTAQTLPKSLWLEKDINHDYGKKSIQDLFDRNVMSFPKSPFYIIKMILLGMGSDDIILDFFAGSGTTAHAVMQQNAEDGGNRKWICVQLPEDTDENSEAFKQGYKTIADIAKERIRRASEKISKELDAKNKQNKNEETSAPDLGFKAFKLAESSFKVWDSTVTDPYKLEQQMIDFLDPVKPGADDLDMLFELMLKSGIPLTAVREKRSVGKEGYWIVPAHATVFYLGSAISQELFDDITAGKPEKIVLLDRCFKNDDVLKANLLLQTEQLKIQAVCL